MATGEAPAGRAVGWSPAEVNRAVAGLTGVMSRLRRDIHAHPELGWNEVRTTALVARHLSDAGLDPKVLPGGTGLVCDVAGTPGGPVVALRADLDALPIADDKAVPYRSTVAGVSHSCGHDVHTAVVAGAGMALARLAGAGLLPGTVRLIFQPAEEVMPGGALSVLDAGALDGVERVFALHCDPHVDTGRIALRAGAITAATDMVSVVLSGPGGHTARPHLTCDVVAALADVLSRTPTLLSRLVDPRAGASLMWGRVSAGSAGNVIPERAEATGTVRLLDRQAWDDVARIIPRLVSEVAAPYGAVVEVDYQRGVPPAVNDQAAVAGFAGAVAAALGPGTVVGAEQSMGGEDFAWILDRVPGVLARLGVRSAAGAPDLHRGDFDVDEACLDYGCRALVAGAAGALAELSPG